jgi:RPA family protein
MEKQKTIMIIIIIAAFIVGAGAGFATGFFVKPNQISQSGMVSLYPSSASEVGNEWLVKIDDYAISKKEFEEGFEYFMSQLKQMAAQQGMPEPSEEQYKTMYLDNLISQYVLVIQALKEETFADKENELLLKLAIRDAIYKVYLNKYLPEDEAVFQPSRVELNQAFNQYRDQFAQMGWSSEQIRQYLTQQLAQQKMQIWMQNLVNQTKERYKIERNRELLEKKGIRETQTPDNAMMLPDMMSP